jgi:enterochelin esterase-like enzyme
VFGVLVAGTDDRDYLPQQREVRRACQSAGMTVEWVELPGGHNWAVWGPGLATGLDRITGRLGLDKEKT